MIDKQIGAANLAAIIIEPVQGEGGFIVPAPGFLLALRAWCTDNDVVFIDDVQKNIDAAVDFGWQGIQFSEPTQLHEELRKRQYL